MEIVKLCEKEVTAFASSSKIAPIGRRLVRKNSLGQVLNNF